MCFVFLTVLKILLYTLLVSLLRIWISAAHWVFIGVVPEWETKGSALFLQNWIFAKSQERTSITSDLPAVYTGPGHRHCFLVIHSLCFTPCKIMSSMRYSYSAFKSEKHWNRIFVCIIYRELMSQGPNCKMEAR